MRSLNLRRLAVAALVCAPACDRVDHVEVARVATDDQRNRIVQTLIDLAPTFDPGGNGSEPVYVVKVPRRDLGAALERLRVYGFDCAAPQLRDTGGLFGGAENETTRRAMESERIAAAICCALKVDPSVISAVAVVNLTAPRKVEPRLAEAKEADPGSIGSASVVLRATCDDAERDAETARIVALCRRVLAGQGLEVAGVDVVTVPPLPVGSPPEAGAASATTGATALPEDRTEHSRVLAYSLLANALCGLIVLFKVLGSLRRRGAAAKVAPLPKSVSANRPTRGAA